jgi:hypothetical protein
MALSPARCEQEGPVECLAVFLHLEKAVCQPETARLCLYQHQSPLRHDSRTEEGLYSVALVRVLVDSDRSSVFTHVTQFEGHSLGGWLSEEAEGLVRPSWFLLEVDSFCFAFLLPLDFLIL